MDHLVTHKDDKHHRVWITLLLNALAHRTIRAGIFFTLAQHRPVFFPRLLYEHQHSLNSQSSRHPSRCPTSLHFSNAAPATTLGISASTSAAVHAATASATPARSVSSKSSPISITMSLKRVRRSGSARLVERFRMWKRGWSVEIVLTELARAAGLGLHLAGIKRKQLLVDAI